MNSTPATCSYSMIVPAYNEEKLLGKTLARLNEIMAVIPEPGEIIVTDNNSTDRTAEIARFHGARVVFEAHRQIARSRNTGARASRGTYLFFIDADTLVSEPLIRACLTLLQNGTAVGGGALPAFTRGTAHDKAIRRITAFWNFLAKSFHWACGAYLFCRRDAFEAVGGFNEKLYASEEIVLSRALRQWGRTRGMEFVILQHTIETSPRKLEWYGLGGMIRQTLPVVICPLLLRSQRFCRFWYTRPPET